jgi:hypothetical protein
VFGGVVFQGEAKAGESWRRGKCVRFSHGAYAALAESSEPERNKSVGEPLPGGAQVGGIFKASSGRGIVKPGGLRDRGLKVGIPKGTLFGTGLGRREAQPVDSFRVSEDASEMVRRTPRAQGKYSTSSKKVAKHTDGLENK